MSSMSPRVKAQFQDASMPCQLPLSLGVAVTAVLTFTLTPNIGSLPLFSINLLLFLAIWLGFMRYMKPAPNSWQCTVLRLSLPLAAFFSTLANPTGATLQVAIYPLIWSISRTRTENLVLHVFVVLGVTLGYGLGMGGPWWLYGAIIAAASALFSGAIGFWIYRIEKWGKDRAELLAQLQRSQDELNNLHHANGVIAERERLAQEIHDTIAQSLTGIVIQAQQLHRSPVIPNDENSFREQIAAIETLSLSALQETRSLVATNAQVPHLFDLDEALQTLAQRFERERSIQVEVIAETKSLKLARELEVVLLRCAQEGLANVRKHAPDADTVRIRIKQSKIGVQLSVSDNGSAELAETTGFTTTGFGLSGIQNRITPWQGTVALNRQNQITTLLVQLSFNES